MSFLPLNGFSLPRLFQVLSKKRLGFFPCVLRRGFVIAAALIAEKAVPGFGINFHLEGNFLGGQFGVDLTDLIHGNELILRAEKQVHRALDFAGPGKRAGLPMVMPPP